MLVEVDGLIVLKLCILMIQTFSTCFPFSPTAPVFFGPTNSNLDPDSNFAKSQDTLKGIWLPEELAVKNLGERSPKENADAPRPPRRIPGFY